MENTFDLTNSLASQGFQTLNYEDIKGPEISIQGASWKDFITPNKSTVSFDYSSISSLASPANPEELLQRLEKIRESCNYLEHSQAHFNPLCFEDSHSKPPSPSESNEFLRKKTKMSIESLRKSAENIVEFAMTGKSTDGLPDTVTPGLVVSVVNQLKKETNKIPTVEHLLKFVELIKDEKPGKTVKNRENTVLEMQLRKSLSEVATLHRTMADYQEQIKTFQDVIKESMSLMKDMNYKWTMEKKEADKLREIMKMPNEEIVALKKALFECEKDLKKEKSNRKSNVEENVQTDESFINEILEQNKQLKLQMKQNLETFDKLAENVANSKNYEKALLEKQQELETLKKNKEELVEAVEQLIESAQKIMESSKGSKQQKLRIFAELMGSLKSISLSDLQR